ncbi:MAG TPA: YceI family protein [Bacteroidales bacterium]|nr:YceI family protein [Bacteroidales bacterium]
MTDHYYNFPTSKLVITGSDSFEKGTATVRGDLTVKQNNHPIEFKATVKQGNDGIWFYANIIVDRTKYNVRYGSGSFFSNLGDNVIYDEFKVKVSLYVR